MKLVELLGFSALVLCALGLVGLTSYLGIVGLNAPTLNAAAPRVRESTPYPTMGEGEGDTNVPSVSPTGAPSVSPTGAPSLSPTQSPSI